MFGEKKNHKFKEVGKVKNENPYLRTPLPFNISSRGRQLAFGDHIKLLVSIAGTSSCDFIAMPYLLICRLLPHILALDFVFHLRPTFSRASRLIC